MLWRPGSYQLVQRNRECPAEISVSAARSASTGALGEQGLHIVRQAAKTAEQVERAARRARVEELSTRLTPGTSNLLTENRALEEEHHGVDREGKPGKIKVYDNVGVAPIHWCRPGIERRKLPAKPMKKE